MSDYLSRAGEFIRALSGWHRIIFAFAAGLVSALGFAPFYVFPALLLGFAAIILLIDAAPVKHRIVSGAAVTWAFGFGQYALGMHWIAFAFLVDPVSHGWQIPFVFLFFAALALFQFAAGALATWLWRCGAARVLIFTLAYGLAEWMRGHILTGFPWNLPAYGWGASLAVLQSTALIGAYGLSLLTVLFGASLAGLFSHRFEWKLPAVMAGIFALFFVGGSIRLASLETAIAPGVTVRLVQPNVSQEEKYDRKFVVRNWRRLIELSRAPGNPSLIIWPEAAPPFIFEEQPLAMEQVSALAENGQGLITGALRREFAADETLHYFNSLYVFGKSGTLLHVYDKTHLVPFGEYLPFEQTLTELGLQKITGIDGSFTQGSGPVAVKVPGAGIVTPLICYEILFPGEVAASSRASWFVNVTDDSWFGPWAGPRQHLLVAQVRAIEEGVPVVRAANTGISAVIDAHGRITRQLGLGQMGFLDAPLPASIAATPYSRFSPWVFWVLLCVVGGSIGVLSRRK